MSRPKEVRSPQNVDLNAPSTAAGRGTFPTVSEFSKSNYSRLNEFEAFVIIPPDGGIGWLIVVASFLCQFLTDGSMYTFGIFIKEITFSLQCPEAHVTLSSSIQNSCYNISGPIVCALTNRFGFRCVCMIGLILTSLSYIIASFVESVYLFILCHGLIGGVGFGMVYLPSLIIVGFYFEKWRALATSIIVSGSAFGTVVFPPVFTILLQGYTWRDKFRIISGLALCLLVCAATYRPIKPTKVMRQKLSDGVVRLGLEAVASAMTSPLAVNRVFSKNHNVMYPTAADVVNIVGDVSIMSSYDPSPASSEIMITPTVSQLEQPGSDRLEMIREETQPINKCQLCCLKLRHTYNPCQCSRARYSPPFRPMYRDDVLFTASAAAASYYSYKNQGRRSAMDYNMSVTRVMTQRDCAEDYIPCVCCPIAVKRTLATMFDCSIVCSPSFLVLAFSAFMSTLGIFIPYLYIVDASIHEGHKKPSVAITLMTVLGISNAVGRLACGVLSFVPRVKPLEFSAVALSLAGLTTAFFTISYEECWLFSYVVLYGLGLAVTSVTRPLIIVELVGLEKLSNAFGLQSLFQGVACLVGIPIASALLDVTGSYRITFHFAGGAILIAGILLGVIRPVNNKEKSRNN